MIEAFQAMLLQIEEQCRPRQKAKEAEERQDEKRREEIDAAEERQKVLMKKRLKRKRGNETPGRDGKMKNLVVKQTALRRSYKMMQLTCLSCYEV